MEDERHAAAVGAPAPAANNNNNNKDSDKSTIRIELLGQLTKDAETNMKERCNTVFVANDGESAPDVSAPEPCVNEEHVASMLPLFDGVGAIRISNATYGDDPRTDSRGSLFVVVHVGEWRQGVPHGRGTTYWFSDAGAGSTMPFPPWKRHRRGRYGEPVYDADGEPVNDERTSSGYIEGIFDAE